MYTVKSFIVKARIHMTRKLDKVKEILISVTLSSFISKCIRTNKKSFTPKLVNSCCEFEIFFYHSVGKNSQLSWNFIKRSKEADAKHITRSSDTGFCSKPRFVKEHKWNKIHRIHARIREWMRFRCKSSWFCWNHEKHAKLTKKCSGFFEKMSCSFPRYN